MQNLDLIIKKIKDEAIAAAEAEDRRSQQKCELAIKDAEEKAKAVMTGARASIKRESLATVERAYSAAEMQKRSIMLAAKVGMINKAFEKAERCLCELSDEDYCVFCGHLLADAVKERIESAKRLAEEYGEGDGSVPSFEAVFNAADKDVRAPLIVKAAKAFLKRESAELGKTPISVCGECADIDGGLILRCGDIEINCSVASVVAAEKEKRAAEIAAIIFAPARGGDEGGDDEK